MYIFPKQHDTEENNEIFTELSYYQETWLDLPAVVLIRNLI